jgi:catechol 2,3-dioxygenase-like lactoylglutathione lyase family enzyme
MPVQAVTPILNVSNIAESIAWFEKLGWRQGFVWCDVGQSVPSFGSVCSGKAEVFLCRGAQGSRGSAMPTFPGDDVIDGVWMSWWMASPAEVDAAHQAALGHGMTVTYPPTDEPWKVREFHLRHPDGHTFRVSAGLGETED